MADSREPPSKKSRKRSKHSEVKERKEASEVSTKNNLLPGKNKKIKIPLARRNKSILGIYKQREIGYPFKVDSLQLVSKLDLSLTSYKSKLNTGHGAVFNLEFSPDNKYLVAACENKDVLIYDPCIHKKIEVINEAHADGVNCITFLDTRTFATCSNDETIALWDIRNVKKKIFTLKGHTSWVKSINYSRETGQLLSSAFDDTVRVWNINSRYSEDSDSVKSKTILNVPYLTRTKLCTATDGTSKLVAATTTGVLFVIHNLNLDTVLKDTEEELQSLSSIFNNLNSKQSNKLRNKKSRKTNNRIEFIQEFPSNSKPWCIASIQIHPTKDSILSRYTTLDVESEWSVVHSIYDEGKSSDAPSYQLESYIEESNSTPGFIKELCYNYDGRLIFSPFGYGVRSLSSNTAFQEKYPRKSTRLLEDKKLICSHKNTVLTTRCAPYFPMLTSGCLDGQVVFYQPKL